MYILKTKVKLYHQKQQTTMNWNIKTSNTLPKPVMPDCIPTSCQWLAGEGAGSWFYISPLSGNVWHVVRYSDAGVVECEGDFEMLESKSFDEQAAFSMTYPSHCAVVSIVQNDEVITLQRKIN